MGVFDRVKNAIGEALLPQRAAENKELAYLRQIYENRDGGIRRNQWYRLLNQNGDHVGFSFSCACGQEYQMLDVSDWQGRQHVCRQCKTEFDLFKTVGITTDTPAAQWAQHYAKLPARPRLTGKRSTPFIDTWDNSDKEVVQYERGNANEGWV